MCFLRNDFEFYGNFPKPSNERQPRGSHVVFKKYKFETIQQIATQNAPKQFDFVGIVAWAGPIERERQEIKKLAMNDASKQGYTVFFEYRWIKIIDGSSELGLPIKVFTNSQENLYRYIAYD